MASSQKYLQIDRIFELKSGIHKGLLVQPFNGETEMNDVSWSHGITHYKDAKSGETLGFCGVFWFEKNAKHVVFR